MKINRTFEEKQFEYGVIVREKAERENWKEWFRFFKVINTLDEGCIYPKFYLPVSRESGRMGYICWILPLAPIALVYIAFIRGFREFWFVLIDAIDKWPKSK